MRGVPHFLPYEPRRRRCRTWRRRKAATASIDPAFWTPIGPAPIPNGQTQAPASAVSGRTISIAVHPTNPNLIYVGTAQGGIYRTSDGGVNWTPIFDSAMSLAIGALALAPSDPEILYVGTGEPNGSADSFFGVGLYRINNASTTANLTGPIDPLVTTGIPNTTAFTGRAISRILVHPTDAAHDLRRDVHRTRAATRLEARSGSRCRRSRFVASTARRTRRRRPRHSPSSR
jgi:hypothetical protein